jgi:hypothetical protein
MTKSFEELNIKEDITIFTGQTSVECYFSPLSSAAYAQFL